MVRCWRSPGTRGAASDAPGRRASTPGSPAAHPMTRRVRAVVRPPRRPVRVHVSAAAKPAIPARFSRPALRARSWSAPGRSGSRRTPRRTSNAPIPVGPPNLCAVTDMRSMPDSSNAMGTRPIACAASTCSSTPRARHSAATVATGCTVPTSWLAHCRCTTAVSGPIAAITASGSTRPPRSTPTTVAGPRSAQARTAECSTALTTVWAADGSGPRRTAPWAAMAIASVAPEQKTTSRGRAPRARATRSRACSTPCRATRPSWWERPGSPSSPRLDWRNTSAIASAATGRSGAVEAWSR